MAGLGIWHGEGVPSLLELALPGDLDHIDGHAVGDHEHEEVADVPGGGRKGGEGGVYREVYQSY